MGLVIYREIRPRDILPVLISTASLTGMVMLLVGTASVLSWIFAAQGIPRMIAGVLLATVTQVKRKEGWCYVGVDTGLLWPLGDVHQPRPKCCS